MEALLAVQKCRSWEEIFYWKHLKTVHFFCILPDDFHERLVLPQKFAGNMFLELPTKVTLFGPGGAKWDVTLTKTKNVAIAGDGWKEFVKAYALEASYLLMFKYKQSEGFEVLIFDQETCCEKEAGYFVKNDMPTINSTSDDDQQKKRSSDEAFATSTEVFEDDEDNFDNSEFVICKRVKKETEDPMFMEGNHEIVQSLKPNEPEGLQGGMPNSNQTSGEQPVVENRESGLELGCSHQSSEIRGMMQNGTEGAEEHISPETGEGNVETVQSPKPNEAAGKTNGSELVNELSTPENRGSILEFVHRLRCYETRGKKAKGSEASKEQHETLHSPKSTEVIGNTPNDVPEIDGRTVAIHACKSSRGRGRPRKHIAPKKDNLVNENDLLGDKSNIDNAQREQNGRDTGASTLEMGSSDNTSKFRGRTRSSLKLESDLAMGWHSKEYVSTRRPVTEKEKANALRRAEQGLSDKSFIAMMRPTAVNRKFYLNIPSYWAHKFLPCQNRKVVLRVGDKTWPASFYYYPKKAAGLSGAGWKKFVFDNHLEEFDVCVVKLVGQKGDAPIVFDIKIFRVIPETVPPTLTVPF